VRTGILQPLREFIDQFVAEGVLIPDNSCEFASPLVVVHKKDGGIRMAVGYREVNQLPFHKALFQQFQGMRYFANVDTIPNLWG
jgi:hypothetical protein